MKTHTGKIANYLIDDGTKIATSYLDGTFYGGYTVMSFKSLSEKTEGKDLVYDVMLKELSLYKPQLKRGDEVTVHIEWVIDNEYTKYNSCRVLRVEVGEKV